MPPVAPSIFQLLAAAREGKLRPVHVLVGTETLLIERAISALRRASVGEGIPGFNDDTFDGRGLDAGRLVAAARTVPMMSDARFVLLRNADAVNAAGQDALAAYLAAPSPSACVVIVAEKLDGRGKLSKAAKASGALTTVQPLKGSALREFAIDEASARGHTLSTGAAQALLDALGDDLSGIDDSVERLSLYVGPGQRIDEAAVEACVTRVRTDTIWALVDAISVKDAPRALAAATSLLADREPALKILAMISRQLRIVAKMRQGLADGLSDEDAVRAAGAPPFKANELKRAARRFSMPHLTDAFRRISEADRWLKGSRVPPDAVLQEAILQLCASPAR